MKKLTLIEKIQVVAGRFCLIGLPNGFGLFCWD